MARRFVNPEGLDQAVLEEAARLLLGPEFKRPLATLLGPYHPDGPRANLNARAPFRWFAPPLDENGEPNRGWRPIPAWVWPVISELLHQRALDLANEGRAAMRLSNGISILVREGQK